MKISGYFKPGPLEAAYITAKLIIKELGIEEEVEFLIDTGASKTIISDRDALWLGIDHKNLKKTKPSIGIGGSVQTFAIEKPELIFATEDGSSFQFRFDNIYVMRHRRVDDRIRRIPSILGRDFLNQFTLTYSRRDEIASIADER